METFGDLTDRISIARIRLEKLQEEGYDESKIKIVKEQIDTLSKEISTYLMRAINGEVKLEFPKVKMYHHEEASGSIADSLGEAIDKLTEANYRLWNLEDYRRDKKNSDKDRLEACDEVSSWNRKRNDCIDLVNSILATSLERKDK